MVFRSKAKTPTKNTPMSQKKGRKSQEVKKAESDGNGDLFDMSDDDDVNIKETKVQNGSKTPNAKNGERRVSFQIPDSKTPSKTPKKDTSILGKKAPTPAAKGSAKLQQFKGIKKQSEEDDEAEDDSEDDDDFNMDDMDSDDFDDDDFADEDDDDDADEDDDEEDADEDGDEEDEDDEEEDAEPSPKAAPTPQKGKNDKTPAKSVTQKGKNEKTPKSKEPTTPKAIQEKTEKSKTPNKKINEKDVAKANMLEARNREQHEKITLFIGHLPQDVTPNEIKALSTSIKDVNIPKHSKASEKKFRFAYLVFENEEAAEEAHKQLQSATVRGEPIEVDYVGQKSKKKQITNLSKHFDSQKLYVTGVPIEATISDVAKFFPKATLISFSPSTVFKAATVGFRSEADATEAILANKDTNIQGSKLVVLHAYRTQSTKSSGGRKRKHNQHGRNRRVKKAKRDE